MYGMASLSPDLQSASHSITSHQHATKITLQPLWMSLGLVQSRQAGKKKKIEQKKTKTAVVAVYFLFNGEHTAAIYLRVIPCLSHEV